MSYGAALPAVVGSHSSGAKKGSASGILIVCQVFTDLKWVWGNSCDIRDISDLTHEKNQGVGVFHPDQGLPTRDSGGLEVISALQKELAANGLAT